MQQILVIEDDNNILELIKELVDMFKTYEVTLINPTQLSLEEILDNIASKDYAFIMIDHHYSEKDFTGKDITQACNYQGPIYSISANQNEIDYCNKYIGKLEIINFFKKLYTVNEVYA